MVKRRKIPKDVAIMSMGAAVGVAIPVALVQFVDTDPVTFPPIFPEWGTWGKWGTLAPIVLGALGLSFAVFTDVIKKPNTRRFIGMFGVTSLASGVLTGLFAPPGARFRAPTARAMARPTVRRNAGYYGVPSGGITPTGITGQTVYA